VILDAGKPPAMPYSLSPFVQAVTASSMLYFLVPGAMTSVGSDADAYSGDWW
jgi:hypothetical protein